MRGIAIGAAFAVVMAAGAQAADCPDGSGTELVVEDWMVRLGEIAADGTRPLVVELTYRNPGEKGFELVDGDVYFYSATGELLAAAPIEPNLLYAAGGLTKAISTRRIVNDPLERMIRASRADVLTQTCVSHVRYEGGGEADF